MKVEEQAVFMNAKGTWAAFLLALSVTAFSQAQVYTDQDTKLAAGFMAHFNHDDFSDLYESHLSDRLKEQWPPEKAFEFFLKLKKDSGRITRLDISDTFASTIMFRPRVWPISFEKGELDVQLVTDESSKVTDIVIRPKSKVVKKHP